MPHETADLRNKVPAVTLAFWAVKIMSTTVGETGADFLAVNAGLGLWITCALTFGVLAVLLSLQFSKRSYVPWTYWTTVVLVSVAGTQITDILTDKLEVSLYASTTFFAIALVVLFAVWFSVERTLSIRSIVTSRREAFYWAAILLTFALGTAAGDLATEALGLGFTIGTAAFAASIGLAGLAYLLGADGVLVFWVTYILTRPLGASFGDLLSQRAEYGGLGLGATWTSAAFLVVIFFVVAGMTVRQRTETATLRAGQG